MGLVLLLPLLWPLRTPPPALELLVLDVGQGTAVIARTATHTLVYDAGPAFRSGGDAGAMAVEPYLRHRGVRAVDVLVASHDDLDHTGGAASIVRLLPVRRLVASGHALDALGPTERCRRGDRWTWDGLSFEWLHPGDDAGRTDNDGSCVLRVRAGPHTLLLTGDIERRAEADLLVQDGPGRADVIVVPHHGSRTSSTQAFVAATRPDWALVPSGHRNRWGLPKQDVVERWGAAGAAGLSSLCL